MIYLSGRMSTQESINSEILELVSSPETGKIVVAYAMENYLNDPATPLTQSIIDLTRFEVTNQLQSILNYFSYETDLIQGSFAYVKTMKLNRKLA